MCILLVGCEQTSPEIEKEIHSIYYNEKYNVEDVINSFNEIVLSSEYSEGEGDTHCVQKWDIPIYYHIDGYYQDEDIQILEDLFDELNQIPDFPQISISIEEQASNLNITFYKDRDSFNQDLGDFVNYEEVDGAVRYSYWTDTNNIYEEVIGYILNDGVNRKSVLLEEVINGLGVNDSETREDSIVYQYSSDNEQLSDMDKIIISLLYNKKIECGMNKEVCETIIRELYY